MSCRKVCKSRWNSAQVSVTTDLSSSTHRLSNSSDNTSACVCMSALSSSRRPWKASCPAAYEALPISGSTASMVPAPELPPVSAVRAALSLSSQASTRSAVASALSKGGRSHS
eukprot:CAMPEP_0176164428 /NCGR_PEP_ID=MMETSP0120_2-20121206/84113_1 /TAXON_ID=160619 /ORGANISM="Kryptoperidinium foliaceum, Strain CCMP 1326" /LENGTH=112 /DNA_ID=CAMNT_0017501959 /DNA_START=126 /DNA_END=464 /DNA_ORIENTATION=-